VKLPRFLRSPHFRVVPLDGKILFFDRRTGTNVLVTSDETKDIRRAAPRQIQVALTNACNKTCGFCYRPLEAKSRWTFDELVDLAKRASEWGVLEIAFGGGEPTIFPKFAELLQTIWRESPICPNFTTNGLKLTSDFLRSIKGSYGQLQLSVYDEDDTNGIIDLLVREQANFGLNYLITPARVRTLEADVLSYSSRGVKDMLFLSYKGTDPTLHLSTRECKMFDESVAKLHDLFADRMTFKVDVCWAGRLVKTPQLLNETDCQANIDFLSITSDKRVLSCSFANEGPSFNSFEELIAIYESMRDKKIPSPSPGCARLPSFGFTEPPAASAVAKKHALQVITA
jgi:MoaA/NifB/PqqE/SkfB family radical SAM enzyme